MSTATVGRHRTGPIDLRDLTAERPVRAPGVDATGEHDVSALRAGWDPPGRTLMAWQTGPLPLLPVKGPDPEPGCGRRLARWLRFWWAAVLIVGLMSGAVVALTVMALLAQRGPDAVPAPRPVPSPSPSWSPPPGACVLSGGGFCDGPAMF